MNEKHIAWVALVASSLSMALPALATPLMTTITVNYVTVTTLSGSANQVNMAGFSDAVLELTAEALFAGAPLEDGTVSFFDLTTVGSITIANPIAGCAAEALAGGFARCVTTFSEPGSYELDAQFSGFSASTTSGMTTVVSNYLGSTSTTFDLTVVNPNAKTPPPSVPSPDTGALMLAGLGGLLLLRRKGTRSIG